MFQAEQELKRPVGNLCKIQGRWVDAQSRFYSLNFVQHIIDVLSSCCGIIDGRERASLTRAQCGNKHIGKVRRSAVDGAECLTGTKIRAFQVLGSEGCPCAGAENPVFRHIVHVDGNPQHGGQRDQFSADVTM